MEGTSMCIEDSMNRIAEYEGLIAKEREGIAAEIREGKMEVSCQQMFQFAKNFRKLSADEIRIVDYLMRHNHVEMSLSEFSIALESKFPSAISKAIDKLEERGIIHVERKKKNKYSSMQSCSIVEGWINVLLESE